jgi:hypothetical protein
MDNQDALSDFSYSSGEDSNTRTHRQPAGGQRPKKARLFNLYPLERDRATGYTTDQSRFADMYDTAKEAVHSVLGNEVNIQPERDCFRSENKICIGFCYRNPNRTDQIREIETLVPGSSIVFNSYLMRVPEYDATIEVIDSGQVLYEEDCDGALDHIVSSKLREIEEKHIAYAARFSIRPSSGAVHIAKAILWLLVIIAIVAACFVLAVLLYNSTKELWSIFDGDNKSP